MEFENSIDFANKMISDDPLKVFRDEFHFPQKSKVYLCGHSLGLQPKKAKDYIVAELDHWAKHGVEGHFLGEKPWVSYHENVTQSFANLVGAKPIEVVAMNTLSVNLHLMMASFYRPTKERFKIIVEKSAFPSDQYAVSSQISFHGFDPSESLIEVAPQEGTWLISQEDINNAIEEHGNQTALVLFGNVNYLTGQKFNFQEIIERGHKKGAYVGFDLAHGAGNLKVNLNEWGPDFSVWCTYKYLNSGPGNLGGCFVHERHSKNFKLPRFAGWWGHDKSSRFKMGSKFQPIEGAEGWQLSNPPIFQLASMQASLELFDKAGMDRLRAKSKKLTGYLEFLLNEKLSDQINILTPSNPEDRGSQLSIQIKGGSRAVHDQLSKNGVICDFREPDILRVAPAAIYNNAIDVFNFVQILKGVL